MTRRLIRGYVARTVLTNALPNEPVPPVSRIDLSLSMWWVQRFGEYVVRGRGLAAPESGDLIGPTGLKRRCVAQKSGDLDQGVGIAIRRHGGVADVGR